METLRPWFALKSVYGLQISPSNFQEFMAEILQGEGARQGAHDSQFFVLDRFSALVSLHADDLLISCPQQYVDDIKGILQEKLTVKWGDVLGEKPANTDVVHLWFQVS